MSSNKELFQLEKDLILHTVCNEIWIRKCEVISIRYDAEMQRWAEIQ